MSEEKKLWKRYRIEEIGLSIEVYKRWTLEKFTEENSVNIYQRIGDTGGLLFVRYGEDETIENYIQKLDDLVTQSTIVNDEKIIYCDRNARHVNLVTERQSLRAYRQDTKGSLIHEDSPTIRTIVSIIGFNDKDNSVLIGYRVPETNISAYQTILDRFINNATLQR